MIRALGKVKRTGFLALANVLRGTHFFGAKRILYRKAGIRIGEGSRIVGPIHKGSESKLSIGSNAWVGHDLHIEGNGTVSIGDNVDLAPPVHIRYRRARDWIGESQNWQGQIVQPKRARRQLGWDMQPVCERSAHRSGLRRCRRIGSGIRCARQHARRWGPCKAPTHAE